MTSSIPHSVLRLGFMDVKIKVVFVTPCYQMLNPFSIGCLVIISDQANQLSVICELDY